MANINCRAHEKLDHVFAHRFSNDDAASLRSRLIRQITGHAAATHD